MAFRESWESEMSFLLGLKRPPPITHVCSCGSADCRIATPHLFAFGIGPHSLPCSRRLLLSNMVLGSSTVGTQAARDWIQANVSEHQKNGYFPSIQKRFPGCPESLFLPVCEVRLHSSEMIEHSPKVTYRPVAVFFYGAALDS